ncbi:MAG: terminase small subunit [Clostridium sp.]|nr:terminase small subunit [Clostridium sp.]
MATEKMNKFCQEYVVDYNGTRAAIRAGYSEKTAAVQASRLLKDPNVIRKIKEHQKQQVEESCISEEWVIKSLLEIYEKCMDAKPVMVWDSSKHKYVESGKYEYDAKNAMTAAQLIGKHLGMFGNKRGLNGEEENNGSTAEFIDALKGIANNVWKEEKD